MANHYPTGPSLPSVEQLMHVRPFKQPPLLDPRMMYKPGHEPVSVHNIDAPGWIANGWSHDPNAQPQSVEPIEEEETDSPIEEPKPKQRKNARMIPS